jgi:hypothetical protein
MRFESHLPWLAGAMIAVCANLASAEPPPKRANDVVRIRRDDHNKPIALQTALVRLAATGAEQADVFVDLIGVIHVADKAYYEDINRRLGDYDAVLYELVARPNANIPRPGQGARSAVGGLQMGMTGMLDLAYQLDCIDYTAPNMVHADMSPEEFLDTMRQRNDSIVGTFFRVMGRGLAERAKKPLDPQDWQVVTALFAEDRPHRLKLALAKQFADLEDQMSVFEGADGSTIITERNKKALQVLARELEAGKKQIAVLFGAGHLPDMQRRLEKEFGMKTIRTEWLPAWSLAADRGPAPSESSTK